MKKVSITYIDQELERLYEVTDSEFLRNKRPCLLVLRLKYLNGRHDFLVPIRSNLDPRYCNGNFFELPPRQITRSGRVHALQYTKMFPVDGTFLTSYRFKNSFEEDLVKGAIRDNMPEIVSGCQRYLDNYDCQSKLAYSTDIDSLLATLNIAIKNNKYCF